MNIFPIDTRFPHLLCMVLCPIAMFRHVSENTELHLCHGGMAKLCLLDIRRQIHTGTLRENPGKKLAWAWAGGPSMSEQIQDADPAVIEHGSGQFCIYIQLMSSVIHPCNCREFSSTHVWLPEGKSPCVVVKSLTRPLRQKKRRKLPCECFWVDRPSKRSNSSIPKELWTPFFLSFGGFYGYSLYFTFRDVVVVFPALRLSPRPYLTVQKPSGEVSLPGHYHNLIWFNAHCLALTICRFPVSWWIYIYDIHETMLFITS